MRNGGCDCNSNDGNHSSKTDQESDFNDNGYGIEMKGGELLLCKVNIRLHVYYILHYVY